MFAKTIVLSDSFLDMPLSARCLYFTLGMVADDDGFVNNPKSIMRQCGAQEDDMKILFAKKFLLAFESGVIVIKHWRINNYLQKDRYNETKYLDEKSMLSVEKNGTYHMEDEMYTQLAYTQDRLGKESKEYIILSEEEKERAETARKKEESKNPYGVFENVMLTDDELQKLKQKFKSDWKSKIDNLSEYIASKGKRYKSHYATILVWDRKNNGGKSSEEKEYF